MHIGIVFAGPFPLALALGRNGMAAYVDDLMRKLVKKGHSVTIVMRGAHKMSLEVVGNNLRIFRAPFIKAYPFHVHIHGLFVNRLIRLLQPELDIIHVHSPYVPAVTTSLPVVTTMHSLLKVDIAHYEAVGPRAIAYKMCSNIFSSMELELLRNSDVLTAVSSHLFSELRTSYGLEREGLVLGNGVDEQRFAPANTRTATRDYVLYVGRMDYRKGLFDLIDCARRVCRERPSVSFVLVGTGPLVGHVLKRVADIGIRKNIVVTGHVSKDQLIELYQNASTLALPSHYEGLPTVLLEAMACGIPVVATGIGGHTDVISHGLNGFLVPVKSPGDMARYILTLLDDEDLREKIGRAGRATIENRYTWDRIADKVLGCYQSASSLAKGQ